LGLLAEAGRRIVTAVSTDDSAGYGIIVTSSGVEAAKEFAGNKSAGDLLKFLITHKAGAKAAKDAVCFLRIRHTTLLFLFTRGIISIKPDD